MPNVRCSMSSIPTRMIVLGRGGADQARWRRDPGTRVAVGRSSVPSTVVLEVAPGSAEPARSRLLALAARAGTLDDAPVVVDASGGIGIFGPRPLAIAVARGLAVKLAHRLPPDRWWCAQSGHDWAGALPHAAGPAPAGDGIRFGMTDGPSVEIAIAEREEDLPTGCAVVLSVGAGRPARISWHPDPGARIEVMVEAVGEREATGWALAMRAEAVRTGLLRPGDELADEIGLVTLRNVSELGGSAGLAAVFAVAQSGPLVIDLVAHGPHAVIGGTTGSGKSELLVSWVVALAARYPPSALSFLLVDFKGGAGVRAAHRVAAHDRHDHRSRRRRHHAGPGEPPRGGAAPGARDRGGRREGHHRRHRSRATGHHGRRVRGDARRASRPPRALRGSRGPRPIARHPSGALHPASQRRRPGCRPGQCRPAHLVAGEQPSRQRGGDRHGCGRLDPGAGARAGAGVARGPGPGARPVRPRQ